MYFPLLLSRLHTDNLSFYKITSSRARPFSTTPTASNNSPPRSLFSFTEEEIMIRDLTTKFAQEQIAPKVFEMDENELMDKDVIKGLFSNGVCGLCALERTKES